MVDQCRADVLDRAHPCATPHLDALAARGVRFTRAYTPNAVCSPARASLMTGLLPHNHGVLHVTHNVDSDQCVLRTAHPHWAAHLAAAGYRTAYFGKWHVEHTGDPRPFGWAEGAPEPHHEGNDEPAADLPRLRLEHPAGYAPVWLYGVQDCPIEHTSGGRICAQAATFLADSLRAVQPWCCFVSLPEPHDPFVCTRDHRARYHAADLPLSPSFGDDLRDKPGLYQRVREMLALEAEQHREAAACYFALVTQIDTLLGRLIALVADAGRLDDTIIVFTTDHGEHLGAHGLYCKNIGAFEEVYRIPLVMAGPGIARCGELSPARVGLHEIGPTLLELAGAPPLPATDGASFKNLLADAGVDCERTQGYAEYHGGRLILTQRIVWDGDWKFVFNGFDRDELYHLGDDPHELTNLAARPEHAATCRRLMQRVWSEARRTGDHTLVATTYPSLRIAVVGPDCPS
jgi:arylsulfatase A-like enzyme